jgi:two-component system cell cycle sensor histidine kinase PleC
MPFRGRVFLMPDRHGLTRRISMTGVAVFDDRSGAFMGYRGTGTDVTRHHETEQRARKTQQVLEESLKELRERNTELDRALQEARSAARAKTEFLGKMSHELRTPLNAIIGFAEMSIQQAFGALNSRYLTYFRDIHGAAYHLLNIINDILDLSKIEVGEVHLVESEVDLGNLMESSLSLVRDKALSKSIAMESVVADELPPVRADARLLKQVLLNLLQNAIKFTPADGHVRTGAALTADGGVQITVADTGIGIKAEDIPRALERFGQVDAELSRQYNGAGLGLPLAKSLTELHGGTLSISSEVNHGTIVTVVLPAERVCPHSEKRGKRPRQSA